MSPRRQRLLDATCEVWWASSSAGATQLALLDEAERRRAERLRDPRDRDRFITARALLKAVIAARTGTAPPDLAIDTGCPRCGAGHGRPRLHGSETISFNISHSGHRVALAVTDGATVGVDIEEVDGSAADRLTGMATSILAPVELTDLERLHSSWHGWAMAVLWTRKEALLKATGDGLLVPMSTVTVTAADQPAGLRLGSAGHRAAAPFALLHDLRPDGDTVGCVAVLGAQSLTVVERDGDEVLARMRLARTPAATGRA